MRFVDWVGFRDEEGFKESEHPRDKDGKFKSGASAAGASGAKAKALQPIPTSPKTAKWARPDLGIGLDARGNVTEGMESRFIGRPYGEAIATLKREEKARVEKLEQEWRNNPNKVTEKSSFQEISDSITCKSAARYALKIATRKCIGEHKAILDGVQIAVFVSSVAVEEANNKIGKASVKTQVAIDEAKRHVFALEHLDEILTTGKVTKKWEHSEAHHPEFDFRTFYKRLDYMGMRPVFAIDVSRWHDETNSRKEFYSATNELNVGFPTKAARCGIDMKGCDGAPPRMEVCRIRCTLDQGR